ncbi:MAG TPA: regulatory protein RecX [Rubrivivax sp.]|nr:regulatory protein RecX [Rubrivivax sp.]
MKRPAPDLQARALGWLAQREHSRSELRRKLLQLARRSAADGNTAGTAEAADDADDAELAAQVEQLLDRLQARGLLSEERFVESRVRVRAPVFGTRRIERELAQHGLELPPSQRRQLRDSELQRALQLWQRRFGAQAPGDARERARQMRFLAARGFSGDVIRRVLAAGGLSLPDEAPDR